MITAVKGNYKISGFMRKAAKKLRRTRRKCLAPTLFQVIDIKSNKWFSYATFQADE
jgi:hypothetical protein